MKIKDLRSMAKEELASKLIELKKELIKSNAQVATGTTPKSPGQIKQTKKMIAKILTLQKEKSISKKEKKKVEEPSSSASKKSVSQRRDK